MPIPSSHVDTLPTFDPSRRYVRLRGERSNGFVEFDFAVGEPEVFVELILGREDFAAFCAANQVQVLPPVEPDALREQAPDDWEWRLADATQTRFK